MMMDKPRVLVVDDECLVLEMFSYALRESGCEVRTARTVEEGAELLRKQSFESVVTDLRLDQQNGFDVAELAQELSPETKIIIVTGYPAVADRLRAQKLGYSFLAKPLNLHALTFEVHRAMSTKPEPWGFFRDHQAEIPQRYLL